MPEVGRQDLLLEALDVHDREVRALLVPAGDVAVGGVLRGWWFTCRIWKALAMKMEGPACLSRFQRPRRQASRDSECSE